MKRKGFMKTIMGVVVIVVLMAAMTGCGKAVEVESDNVENEIEIESKTEAEEEISEETGNEIEPEEKVETEIVGEEQQILDLTSGETYEIDLDMDGANEKISFELVMGKEDYLAYHVTINDNTEIIEKQIYDAYDPHIQITDIDTTDGYMDMWIYTMGASEDVVYAALYQYQNGELKKIHKMEPMEIDENYYLGTGILHKAEGNGIFYVRADRAFFVDSLIGNHYDLIPMELKNGEVSLLDTNTYLIEGIYNENNQITVAVETDFYKEAGSEEVGFTAKRFAKVKPVIIQRDGVTLYVQFVNEQGETGWLCANDYGFDEAPFTDLIWVD